MAAETIGAAQWLVSTLQADSTLAGYFGGTVRVYRYPLPETITFPAIVLSHAGGVDKQGLGTFRYLVADQWLVKVIDQNGDQLPAGTIFKRVDAVLHGNTGGTTSFARVYTASRQTTVDYCEVSDGKPYQHIGGTFRLWVQDPSS